MLKRMRLTQRVGFRSNLFVRHTAMKARILERELRAKMAKKRFRCRALSGDSSYNICINADLSVSCNCDDIYGEGRLGSLRHHTFTEVYTGPRAMAFRQALARGKIPISKCVQCPDLQLVEQHDGDDGVGHFNLPTKGIMLETNAGCNLSCIGCGRSYRPLEKQKMTLDELREVVKDLASLGVEMLSFFSLGEPFLSKNILQEMELIRKEHPSVVINTSTNGMLVDSEEKRRAALMMDHVTFSIDGSSQETLVQYQIGSDFDTVYKNLCDTVALRNAMQKDTIITWKYVVFRWNDKEHHVARAIKLAKQAGVDFLEFVFTLNPFFGISYAFLKADYWEKVAPYENKRRVVCFNEKAKSRSLWKSSQQG